MFQKFEGVKIDAIAACVPKNTVKNDHFDYLLGSKELRMFAKTTGIKERRYADEGVTAGDLGFIAAKKLIDNVDSKEEIKALIFLSQTSDYKIPFTSNILQDKLGLSKSILCFDINAGCAGFIQGLSVAYSIASNIEGKVLFVVSETLSKIISPFDRSTTMLFGDGGAAVIISYNKNIKSKSYFNFFSDGSNSDAIIIPDGGYRNKYSESSFEWKEDSLGNKKQGVHLKMDGQKVFDFTLREIPESINGLFDEFHLSKNDISFYLLHQSNKFIINQISSKLKIEKDKFLLNIDKFGNTSGVSIPLLLVDSKDKVNKNDNILLSGYGSGLNWGNSIIESSMKIYDLIEV